MFNHFVKNSRHFGIGINKPHHRGAGDVELAADVGDGFAFPHEGQDFILFGVENLNLRALPGRLPSWTPAAFLTARASLVRMEIRRRSMSAVRPKAKQST